MHTFFFEKSNRHTSTRRSPCPSSRWPALSILPPANRTVCIVNSLYIFLRTVNSIFDQKMDSTSLVLPSAHCYGFFYETSLLWSVDGRPEELFFPLEIIGREYISCATKFFCGSMCI
jgi:hypothetical protein